MFADRLRSIGACKEACAWTVPYGADDQKAWDECKRGDWMLWYLQKVVGIGRETEKQKNLWRVRADCVDIVLHIYEEKYPGDERPRSAIKAVKDYADGLIGEEELRSASAHAYAASDAAYAAAYAASDAAYAASDAASAHAYAAYAAAYAAASAAYAAYAAASAAYAAYAAAYAAYAAAYAAWRSAREKTLEDCADIARKYFPTIPQ